MTTQNRLYLKIKIWREKRQHLDSIQYAFRILRSLDSCLGAEQCQLIRNIENLIIDYANKYGKTDGVAEFYSDHLKYILNRYYSFSA